MVIWLIGLAGAGKTAIGSELYERLKAQKPNVVFLDGDNFRKIMGDDLGHDLDDRHRNAWRMCRFCKYLDDQNIDVVCAILSLFHDTQEWNRQNYSEYLEVFIDVPMDVLFARDQKGLYSGARAGRIKNVAGMDLHFEPPAAPDLVVSNGRADLSPADQAEKILDHMKGRA